MEDELDMAPGKLTLREYTAGFIVLIFAFSSVGAFSGSIFDNYNSNLQGEEEEVKKLNQKIRDQAPDTGTGADKADSISTEDSGSFFLGSVLTVVETVTSGISTLPELGEIFLENLNIDGSVAILFSIPVAAVIWEVVSLYRGIRT